MNRETHNLLNLKKFWSDCLSSGTVYQIILLSYNNIIKGYPILTLFSNLTHEHFVRTTCSRIMFSRVIKKRFLGLFAGIKMGDKCDFAILYYEHIKRCGFYIQ